MSTFAERTNVNDPATAGGTADRERTTRTIEHARKSLERARAERERIRTTLAESNQTTSRYRRVLRRAGLLK
jgi:hypothetical protein